MGNKKFCVKNGRHFSKKSRIVFCIIMSFAVIVSISCAVIATLANGRDVSHGSQIAGSDINSSAIASEESSLTESLQETSSNEPEPSSSAPKASKAPVQAASSKAQAEPTKAQTENKSGLPYDVYAVAQNWTYKIDKSKPVPLQPLADNAFFNGVLFVGDSITTGIDLYGVMKSSPVVAFTGINTDTVLTKSVINTASGKVTFLQAMKEYNPHSIYIMMGINGIAFQTKSSYIAGYGKFIDKVKAQHPNANIYIQSILPVTNKKQKKDSRFANSKINEYNAAILNMAKGKGVYYLNVAEAFKDAYGNLPLDASPNDGIHFGTGYYKRWMEYIRRHTVFMGKIPDEPIASANPQNEQTSVIVSASTQEQTSTNVPESSQEEQTSSQDVSSHALSRPTLSRPPKENE